MPILSHISLADYHYELPEDLIAKFPLTERDSSRLLVYKQGEILHRIFKDLNTELAGNETLFFNHTKVIQARLFFRKESGALIEIFLLEPLKPKDIQQAMSETQSCHWACAIGNLKRWKQDTTLELRGEDFCLKAELTDRTQQAVRLSWDNGKSFAEILEKAGKMPLPPYLKREEEEQDHSQYQTVYAQVEGAVAAPTAGLHFTPALINTLKNKGVRTSELCLHVGGGTFQPVKVEDLTDHPMHAEQMIVSRENLKAILESDKIVAVGTTSMRTLESLYWFGVKILKEGQTDFFIPKLYPYQFEPADLPQPQSALEAVHELMTKHNYAELRGYTEIMIVPGYDFKLCEGLITNFHLPSTTLMLLVGAFVGEDWRKIYDTALVERYRFLSFGDSSLLWGKG